MKFSFKKIALFFIIAITAFTTSRCVPVASEKYSWSQQTHIVVESDTGTYQSETINNILWIKNKPIAKGLHVDPWTVKMSGGAPFIELPTGLVIAVSLDGGDKFGISRLLIDQFMDSRGMRTNLINMQTMRDFLESNITAANIDLPSSAFPSVIGFSNPHDPESAFIVELSNPKILQAEINKISISVTRINDAELANSKIHEALPWLNQKPIVISATTLNGKHIRRSSKVLYGE